MLSPLDFSTQLARRTGKTLIQYFRSHDFGTDLKADHSVVTEADLAADRLITEEIQTQFPNDIIISEERQTQLPGEQNADQPAVWVIER